MHKTLLLTGWSKTVYMTAAAAALEALKWKAAPDGGIVVTIPESLRRNLPCDHIWCLKIKVK